ncbi:contact-dependent growth inhibition system immunity protein [Mesorhizobium sp.]|uniref:contact-dependent growth inhibition system immunity protein n=1 Tax=Mesorhizobium sp. TaxID=1871066 RepID=UPI001677EC2E|nr:MULTISPECIES: contact-dependent growth inhibition system immunity protein [unclassified Mesorhizobium]
MIARWKNWTARGGPTFDSDVVRTSHSLRRKPLNTLTDEELRLAVEQGIALEWLVPLMLRRLAEDSFRAGDFFEGDLLTSLARIPSSYWTEHPAEKAVLATDVMTAAIADDRLPGMTRETQQAVADLRAASE